ncbi:ribonuclease H-like domain-containing protein [Tanacetum coccineum]
MVSRRSAMAEVSRLSSKNWYEEGQGTDIHNIVSVPEKDRWCGTRGKFLRWKDVRDTYDKVDGSSVFNLHKSINSLNQSGASLAAYYNNLNSLWKQFDAMVSLPACTCEAAIYFEKHNQLIKLMQFLMGLDDNYLAIRSNILTREPLPLVKVAFAIFSGKESHRNITFVGATKPTATAFAAKCFELVGYPAGYVKRNFNPTSTSVSSNNTYADVHSNDVTSNNATTNNSHISLSNEQLTRLINLLNDNGVSTASANMVGHLNGTQALITKIGDLKINNDIIMYDVLVVPQCTISLLFVHKLSGDSKFFVGFDESNCYIQDLMANITHQRLGHPADQVLDALKNTLNLDSHSTFNHLCDTYDFSREIWVYMLKGKDDIYDSIGNDDSEATSMDENDNTHPGGTVLNETDFVNDFYENSDFHFEVEELPVNNVRRCLIALSVTIECPLFQLDVNNAFLYEELYEEIYMTIPKGFANKDNKNMVCKLVKSLYRLKQAPKKWNEKLVYVLKENDFVQSVNDYSLFTKSTDNKFIALLVYVDDIVVTENCINEITKFKSFLKSKFNIKYLGSLKYFLGIEVIRTGKDLCLSQRKYWLELLIEYSLLGCKPVSTPMEPNYVWPYIATKDDPLLDNITGYQKLLGKLIYLTDTRPHISYSIHCLAQYMHSPFKSHLNYAYISEKCSW